MTPEQKKVVIRCGQMLKRAFINCMAKFEYNITPDDNKIKRNHAIYETDTIDAKEKK